MRAPMSELVRVHARVDVGNKGRRQGGGGRMCAWGCGVGGFPHMYLGGVHRIYMVISV